MGKLTERARRHDDGFTLIELLIVIIILGILAAIVVLSVSGIKDRGTKAACQADVETVTVASEAYYAKNTAYTDVAGLVSGGFLHSPPTAETFTINTGTGAITYTPAC